MKTYSKFLILIGILLLLNGALWAKDAEQGSSKINLKARFSDTVCKGKVVPINSVAGGGVLYKSENIHGGRGPTFLVQNAAERTGKQVIEIRNARCEVIGSFGLFATDQPYGARYYSKTGGSGHEGDQLLALAQQAGSNNILVEGKDKWIRVKNPTQREGSVRK